MRRLSLLFIVVILLLAGAPMSANAVMVVPFGQDPTPETSTTPVQAALQPASLEVQEVLATATAVAAGGGHTCALTPGGGVACWGENGDGQLGDGTDVDRWTPVAVVGLTTGVQTISAGGNHTCAITVTGAAKCWGDNADGQLGDGTTTDRWTPVAVVGLASVATKIAAGGGDDGEHTCAVTATGGVKCWGANEHGQLGDGTRNGSLTPVGVTNLASGGKGVVTGESHTCALTNASGAKCWGDNEHGQLGDGTNVDSLTPVDVSGMAGGVESITAGGEHTCALTSAGGVMCWGYNVYGQLGDGTQTDHWTPGPVTGLASGVQQIGAGDGDTCAVTATGSVKCWGSNLYGQLGDGTTVNRLAPVNVVGMASAVQAVTAGSYHTCALTVSGGVKCWGFNQEGQLGNGTADFVTTPVAVNTLTSGVQSIAAGSANTCAVTGTESVKCWGNNFFGQLGDGTTADRWMPQDVAGLTADMRSVAAGGDHTCALTEPGDVRCWGYNGYGQLGDGTTTDQLTSVAVIGLTPGVQAVVAGLSHTCAITAGGGVKCWGWNEYGQLGDGTKTNRETPVDVFGLTSGVKAIAAGWYHTCALTDAGAVKCWGWNATGQLGNGTTIEHAKPVAVVGLNSNVESITAGESHTCARIAGGIKCWGWNRYGQLGNGTTTDRWSPIAVKGLATDAETVAAGRYHTCALLDGGAVQCWGDNSSGQLGDGTVIDRLTPVSVTGLGSGVESISAGSHHSCALNAAGAAKCWGLNAYGQLGINPGWNPVDVVWRIPPQITSSPTTVGVVGKPYTYDVAAFSVPAPTFALVVKPAGMTINSTTGLIQWTPGASGLANVTVQAANGIDPPAQQVYTINVQSTGQAPQITSTPVTAAVAGLPYAYDAAATGAPAPVFTLVVKPAGMIIDSTTGFIQWTPGSTGSFSVTVQASNGVTPAAQQAFVIAVQAAPRAPQITSTPTIDAVTGVPYTYDVNATGVPAPVFALLTKPTGMLIDSVTGVIQWMPGATGNYTVTVQASNGVAPAAQQEFVINVHTGAQAPTITSTPVTNAVAGERYRYDVNATGSPAPIYNLVVKPAGMTIDSSTGVIQWNPDALGFQDVTVQASNGVAPPAQQVFRVKVTPAYVFLPFAKR